jgi:hypothetical protein
MAVGYPVKADYATGDVLTAAQMNDLAGTLNTVPNNIGAYAAGKNKIINGDFRINQRAFTSVTATSTYTFDRFFTRTGGDGTGTFTPQVFTPGAAPVAGYEGTNFLRIVTAGSTSSSTLMCIRQHMEDVRTFAGQTITLSFWAKAASGTPKIAAQMNQLFGTGGSTQVLTPGTAAATISTSWARYSYTYTIPSISGKTIGTGSHIQLDFNLSNDTGSFDIWGVQLEAGSVATPFKRNAPSIQAELAACHRYYWRWQSSSTYDTIGAAFAANGNSGDCPIIHPRMRVPPTSIEFSNLVTIRPGINVYSLSNLTIGYAGLDRSLCYYSSNNGAAQADGVLLAANNTTNAFVGLSAEL